MCVCICIYVCFVYLCKCAYVCVSLCMYVCRYVFLLVCEWVSECVRIHLPECVWLVRGVTALISSVDLVFSGSSKAGGSIINYFCPSVFFRIRSKQLLFRTVLSPPIMSSTLQYLWAAVIKNFLMKWQFSTWAMMDLWKRKRFWWIVVKEKKKGPFSLCAWNEWKEGRRKEKVKRNKVKIFIQLNRQHRKAETLLLIYSQLDEFCRF